MAEAGLRPILAARVVAAVTVVVPATVLAALYPAIPGVLALVFLHERLSRQQVLGLVLTGAAIALVSLG